jgi:hypothetical protein
MATINFDATTVEPSNGFEPIPAGKYLAVFSEDEMKPTRNNNGQYLQLTIEIIEGDYQGRKIWARLNLENPNMQAVEIARKELSAICRAVNVLQLTDTTQLLNIPFVLKVGLKKNKETDEGFGNSRGIATAVGQEGGERVVRTVGTAAVIAKNRYGLPEYLPLDFNAFYSAITENLNK